jgi:hypothetical protein
VPGELRRNRKFSNFPPQSENIKVKPGGYTGDFPQRWHILAVCGAKFAAVRPDPAQIAEQGLPLDGAAAPECPVRAIRAIRNPPRPKPHRPEREAQPGKFADAVLEKLILSRLLMRRGCDEIADMRERTPLFARYLNKCA